MICVYVRFFGLCFKMGWVDYWLICYWLLGIVYVFWFGVYDVVSGYCFREVVFVGWNVYVRIGVKSGWLVFGFVMVCVLEVIIFNWWKWVCWWVICF